MSSSLSYRTKEQGVIIKKDCGSYFYPLSYLLDSSTGIIHLVLSGAYNVLYRKCKILSPICRYIAFVP